MANYPMCISTLMTSLLSGRDILDLTEEDIPELPLELNLDSKDAQPSVEKIQSIAGELNTSDPLIIYREVCKLFPQESSDDRDFVTIYVVLTRNALDVVYGLLRLMDPDMLLDKIGFEAYIQTFDPNFHMQSGTLHAHNRLVNRRKVTGINDLHRLYEDECVYLKELK